MKLQWIEDGSDLTIMDHRGKLVAIYREQGEDGLPVMLLYLFDGTEAYWAPVTDQDEAMTLAEEFCEENWEPVIQKIPPWRDEEGHLESYFTPT